MHIWSIANQKGGVGKTTTAVSLAGMLSRKNKSVLLVDLDPHGSLTSYFGGDPDEMDDSVYRLFQKESNQRHIPLASLLMRTEYPGITVLPASTALATLDRQLAGKDGMGLIIKNALHQCEHNFEYVLIDCPPVMGVLMVNALAACEKLLIPVQTEFLALKGLQRMMHTLEMILSAGKTKMEYLIIPTMYDKRTRASRDSLQHIHKTYTNKYWDSVVPVDTRFREASREGVPLTIMTPGSRGSLAYQKLLETLMDNKKIEDEEIRSTA